MQTAPRPKTVVVIGNNITDTVLCVTQLPVDDKVYATSRQLYAGGQGANAATAMALLGVHVAYVGRFGDDDNGVLARASLSHIGIDLSYSVVVPAAQTANAVVIVNSSRHERTIVMHEDPRLAAHPLPTQAALNAADLLYLDGWQLDAALPAAQQAHRNGIPVVSDMEVANAGTRALLPFIHTLIAPARVIRELAQNSDLATAVRAIRHLGPQTVVATCGAEGSLGVDAHGIVQVDAIRCTVLDTTGAGDAYHAGFVVAMLADSTLPAAMRYASAIAAAKCGVSGPRLHAKVIYPPLTLT